MVLSVQRFQVVELQRVFVSAAAEKHNVPATEEDKKAFSFGGLDGAQAAIGLVIVASAAGRLAVLLVIVGLLITEAWGWQPTIGLQRQLMGSGR